MVQFENLIHTCVVNICLLTKNLLTSGTFTKTFNSYDVGWRPSHGEKKHKKTTKKHTQKKPQKNTHKKRHLTQ